MQYMCKKEEEATFVSMTELLVFVWFYISLHGISAGSVTKNEGKSVDIFCPDNTARHTVIWKKDAVDFASWDPFNGVDISNTIPSLHTRASVEAQTGKFTINNLVVTDAGVYTCELTNSATGTVTGTLDTTLYVDRNITKDEGISVALFCPNNTARNSIIWKKGTVDFASWDQFNGVDISNNTIPSLRTRGSMEAQTGKFTINNLVVTDTGIYTCELTNSATGTVTGILYTTVSVDVKPSSMTVTGLGNLTGERTSTRVHCTIGRILLPAPYDVYFKQGDAAEYKVTSLSTSSNSDGTKSIRASTIIHLYKSDNGKPFQCIVRDRGGGTVVGSTNVTMQVAYRPTSVSLLLVDKSTSDPIQAGAQVVFQCTTPDGNPAPILQIYRGSTAVSNTGPSPLKYTRTILDSDNQATFICKATTTGFSGEVTSNVLNLTEIHYKPTVTVTIEGNPVTVAEGDDVTLQCTARGNPPVYTDYKWTYITFGRPESQVVSSGRELVLSRVTYLDNGEYICVVRNSVGQGLGRKRLDVLYSPRIAVESRIVAASIGEPATLSISVTANPANVSFTWKKSDGDKRVPVIAGIVLTDPSSLKSKLFIPSVQGSDYGQYVCTVSHTVGNREFTFEIRPKGPPERPTDFRISSWTSVSVTLTWVSRFNGGSNQSFHIQYKETSRTRWQKDDRLVFPDPGYMKTSKAKVPDLNPTTPYDFRLVAINKHPSTNSSGFTGAFTQKTKARPKVLDDKLFVSITPTVATVSWTISSGIEDITSYVVKYCERGTVACNRQRVANTTATSAVITLDEGFQDYTFSLLIYEEDDLVKAIDQPTSDLVKKQAGMIAGIVVAVLMLLILAIITTVVTRRIRKKKSGRDVRDRETSATGVITEMKDLKSQPQVRSTANENSVYDVLDQQDRETPIYTDLQPHNDIR